MRLPAAPATATCSPPSESNRSWSGRCGWATSAGRLWPSTESPGGRASTADLRFVAELAPYLATGARRGLLVGEANEPQGPDAPGLVVVDERGELESMTPGSRRWLADLPDGDIDRGRLPSAVLAIAARARSGTSEAPGHLVFSRVLARSGRWIVLHGASLVSGGTQRAAVILEPAHPARIAPLLMDAYGLTEREQELTSLVFQGFSTTDIADRLFISAHTVQTHLKNIFDKTGVRSRRELTAQVFFSFYEPRVRDNERRARDSEVLLGGPVIPPGGAVDRTAPDGGLGG